MMCLFYLKIVWRLLVYFDSIRIFFRRKSLSWIILQRWTEKNWKQKTFINSCPVESLNNRMNRIVCYWSTMSPGSPCMIWTIGKRWANITHHTNANGPTAEDGLRIMERNIMYFLFRSRIFTRLSVSLSMRYALYYYSVSCKSFLSNFVSNACSCYESFIFIRLDDFDVMSVKQNR